MVALRAGCARSTVSYVLNGRAKEMRISDRMTQRVARAARQLNYVPNAMASSLRLQRTGLIGVLFAGLTHEWPLRVMAGLRESLAGAGDYHPLITTHDDNAARLGREIRFLLERQVEAVICAPIPRRESFEIILGRRVPLVFIGHTEEDMPDVSYVALDGALSTRAAIRHLAGLGRRKIAYVGGDSSAMAYMQRYAGYCQGLDEIGLPLNRKWVANAGSAEEAASAVRRMFTAKGGKPDAVFCPLWRAALWVQEALDKMGLRQPQDVALLTLEDHLACRLGRVSISTVDQPVEEIGREAGRVALRLIQEPDAAPIHRLIGQYRIIDRGTT